MLTCHILDSGHCLASEHMLIRGGRRQKIACHSLVALLQHPKEGWLLWDAGYAPRMLEVTRGFPYRLYRWATPLRLQAELAIVAQLPRLGLKAEDIRWIILSHLHADHIAGLRDFPNSQPVLLESAYQDVFWRRGWRALGKAFLPALLPDDFSRKGRLLPKFSGPVLDPLGSTFDFFGDGSVLLLELPGHARGQLGMLAETDKGKLLFAADSCWLSESFRSGRPPHPLTHLFIDDSQAMKSTIQRLGQFHQQHPEIQIIPSHCPEVYARYVLGSKLTI